MRCSTPIKLKTGEWGAKLDTANIGRGEYIWIHPDKKTDKGRWAATVDRVLWAGPKGEAIVSIRDHDCSICRGELPGTVPQVSDNGRLTGIACTVCSEKQALDGTAPVESR